MAEEEKTVEKNQLVLKWFDRTVEHPFFHRCRVGRHSTFPFDDRQYCILFIRYDRHRSFDHSPDHVDLYYDQRIFQVFFECSHTESKAG